MANVIFTKGAVTRELSAGRVWPINDATQIGVVTAESESGRVYAYNKSYTKKRFVLRYINLSSADDAWLQSFFKNTVVGPLNTFTFTDEDGTSYTVRWMDTEYPISKEESGSDTNRFVGTITLLQQV